MAKVAALFSFVELVVLTLVGLSAGCTPGASLAIAVLMSMVPLLGALVLPVVGWVWSVLVRQ